MNWTTLIPLIPSILGMVGDMFNTAAPAAAPATNAAVATLTSAERTLVKVVQEILNAAQAIGLIHFGDPLVVDGWAGVKTNAALAVAEAALAKVGIKVG